ncbi:MAG: PfkB family carbohydrate kinase [Candidatus Omnitrophota bacterium]
MSMLVVGTVALDSVQTPAGKVDDVLGGSASYSAVSASFFTKVKLVSIAGEDFPEKHLDFFRGRKIDVRGLQLEKGKTFKWSGYYGCDLNNAQTLKTELNLLSGFSPNLPDEYKQEKFIFLANIDPLIQMRVLNQINKPKLVICDTMNYWITNRREALKDIVRKIDVLVLNDSEAREFAQQSNLVKAAETLLTLGPRLIIIKRGEYGCLLFSSNFVFSIPAYLLAEVTDPTGAGDTFAGAFLGYLADCAEITESSFRKAIVYGTIMSSFIVEDFSLDRLRKLDRTDIEKRFSEFQQMTSF